MSDALCGLLPEEISTELNLAPFQGKQLFRWIHQKFEFEPEKMTDLPKALRESLGDSARIVPLELVEMSESARTGTKKALLRLEDGETVEAVLIRDRKRITLCVSSQVGCALKCSFCATGLAGFTRNLSAGEIVAQALFLLKDTPLDGRTPNIVYMGMGEPFRNYDNVTRSIRILMSTMGLGIGARKITVSTAGEVDAIKRFAEEGWQVRLSVSLHAANDELRSKLVPLNRRFNLDRIREAVNHYHEVTSRQITFEWTMLDGVNDSPEQAYELIRYMEGLRATVNLIPWNPVADMPYGSSPRPRCEHFRDLLTAAGIVTTLRAEKGQDIDAACGQLRRTHGVETPTA